MKGKLTRITGIYTLLGEDDKMIASDDLDMQKDYQIGKLSKQNCDEIFGVVDVDKLAEESKNEYVKRFNNISKYDYMNGFEVGFNKALELNKDKLFTLKQLLKAILWGHDKSTEGVYISRLPYDEFIQSLQQPNEIAVEIEMETVLIDQCNCECHKPESNVIHFMACCNPKRIEQPKLDSNGCLILKKLP